jgi:hypothetical protein
VVDRRDVVSAASLSFGKAPAGAAGASFGPVAKPDRRHVTFDLDTRISTIHLRGHCRMAAVQMADTINPPSWAKLPFFKAAEWRDGVVDPTTQACTGLFYEHLEFHLEGMLVRSVENLLHVAYTGWDPEGPERGPDRKPIACWFNLHTSLDDLLSVDRGFYRADPCQDGDDLWVVEMKKHVRFSDPTNTELAPLLLASWQEALVAPLGESADPPVEPR